MRFESLVQMKLVVLELGVAVALKQVVEELAFDQQFDSPYSLCFEDQEEVILGVLQQLLVDLLPFIQA